MRLSVGAETSVKNKMLLVLAGALAVVLCGMIAMLVMRPMLRDYLKQGQSYARTILPAILSDLSTTTLARHMAAEDLRKFNSAESDQAFASMASNFGRFMSLGVVVCEVKMYFGLPAKVVGHCEAPVRFERADASIDVQIRMAGDKWSVVGFKVSGVRPTRLAPQRW